MLDPSFRGEVLSSDRVGFGAVVALPDGKVLVGGGFARVGGVRVDGVARLQADGTLDPTFVTVEVRGGVAALALDAQGRILIGGSFTTVNGEARVSVARLGPDGGLDATFVPQVPVEQLHALYVYPTSDGGVLVAGRVYSGSGYTSAHVVRLDATGAPTAGFIPVVREETWIRGFVKAADDSFLLYGTVNGTNTVPDMLMRHRPDGSRDTEFVPPGSLDVAIDALLMSDDGALLIGGYAIWSDKVMVRLLPNGTLDETFDGKVAGGYGTTGVNSLARLSDGSLLAAARVSNNSTLMRFSADGVQDTAFQLTEGVESQQIMLDVAPGPSGDGYVFGGFGAIGGVQTRGLARVDSTGAVSANLRIVAHTAGSVNRLVASADGMYVGGSFTDFDANERGAFLAFDADDALVSAFPTPRGEVADIVRTVDGGVVVMGGFGAVSGTNSAGVFKASAQGEVDTSFLQGVSISSSWGPSQPPQFWAGAAQPNGGVLLSGWISLVHGSTIHTGLVRVRPDGTVDPDVPFNQSASNLGPNETARALAVDGQGRILIGASGYDGGFRLQGVDVKGIARTGGDGFLDPTFDLSETVRNARHLWPLEDGGVVLLGTLDTTPSNTLRLLRVAADGTVDAAFVAAADALGDVRALTRTPDGGWLVATLTFDTMSQTSVLRRVSVDGVPRDDFSATVTGTVGALAFDPQGRLWIGGNFRAVNGVRRIGLARFAPPALFVRIEGPTSVVVAEGANHALTAVAEGVEGEVTYQWTRDGVTLVGETAATLALTAFDETKAGSYNVTASVGSASKTSTAVVLALPVAPTITVQPIARDASTGGSLQLRVVATGRPAPTYQWFLDGVALDGETSSTLQLRNLRSESAGVYSVRVTNLGGTVVSTGARVRVTPLFIDDLFQPAVLEREDRGWIFVRAGAADQSLVTSAWQGLAFDGVPASGIVRLNTDGTVRSVTALPAATRWHSLQLLAADGTIYFLSEEIDPATNYSVRRMRRLLPNGQYDAAYGPVFESLHDIRAIRLLADGRLCLAGSFSGIGGAEFPGLVRLMPNGSVDPTFVPAVGVGTGVAFRADGSVVTTKTDGGPTTLIALKPDGALDLDFVEAAADSNWSLQIVPLVDGSVIVHGGFTSIGGVARPGIARVSTTGAVAQTFAQFGAARVVRTVSPLDDGSFVIVGNTSAYEGDLFATRLAGDGSVVFDREYGFTDWNRFEAIRTVAVQPGGGVVFSGTFAEFDGRAVQGFARIRSDGTVDTAFRANVARYGAVTAVLTLPGGKYLVGGSFSAIGRHARPGLAMVNADGTCDESFVPEIPDHAYIHALWRLPSGKVLVKASVPSTEMQPWPSQFVLEADGSLDEASTAAFTGSMRVEAVAADGKIYMAETVDVGPLAGRTRLSRYTSDLVLDESFGTVVFDGILGGVRAIADDQAFVVAQSGGMADADGNTAIGTRRLLTNGRIDPGFNTSIAVYTWLLPVEAPDGSYFVHGEFSQIGGVARAGIARLKRDGTVDTDFVPPATGHPASPGVARIAFERDGKIVVYGRFLSRPGAGQNESNLLRLNPDGSIDTSVNYHFHTFNSVGVNAIATRDNGDIVIGGDFLFVGDTMRFALARITSNRFQANAVAERVEIPNGGTGYLTVHLTGVGHTRFQWLRDGHVLEGADRAVLVLDEFQAAQAGVYQAEVTAADGSITRTEPIDVSLGGARPPDVLGPLQFAETGGLATVRINVPAGTPWTIDGLPEWLRIDSSDTGAGTRAVSFEPQPNLAAVERTATVSISGQSYEFRQRGASSRLVNISTRGRVGTGDDVLIVGFVTIGGSPLRLLSRGVGPSLEQHGVSGVLTNPSMALHEGPTRIDGNDDWGDVSDTQLAVEEMGRVGAFDLLPGSPDSLVLSQLAPRAYTAVISGVGGAEGIVLGEVYDRTPAPEFHPYTRLSNLSTRGRVGAGDEVLIGGFVITGTVPKQLLIRGVGPGLIPYGVSGTLEDPFVRVLRDGVTLAQNDDWAFSEQAEYVAAAFARAAAFELDPQGKDAALVVTLPPGSYTVILSGADGGTGVGLVEVYDLE
ncbi:hypothetical protein ASA1KI_23770 [Opitutales bacterium ASA1]|nr:hypothetical protein ASA1KI_23770 [Opitutales bacterium ASA1]